VVDDPVESGKFPFRAEKPAVIHGPDGIVCEACRFECEGEGITIVDDEGALHRLTYK
jgi:hypothetical protein